MDNATPGFYWVIQYEKSQAPTIAKLRKNSGWEYMSSEHSSKALRNSPWKILKKVEDLENNYG